MTNRIFFFICFLIFVSCKNPGEEKPKDGSLADNPEQPSMPSPEKEELMKAATQKSSENPYKNAIVEVKTFRDSLGWGYDIFINKSQYVHQPHIPAVPGNRGFSNEESAKKTGEFVGFKIKNNIMPPSVTTAELDSLGVLK